MLRKLTAIAALVLGVTACSAGRQGSDAPRLVLLYATCTLNRSYLEPYDGRIAFTPHLARFAAQGAVFANHQTESGLSGTAYASIFSGAQADRHGVFKHPARLDDELYLIFEAFADAGFETFYWGAHPMAAAELNYHQGVKAGNVAGQPLVADDPRFRQLLERLRRDDGARAFVATTFTVTHGPYGLDSVAELLRLHPQEAVALADDEIAAAWRLYRDNYLPLQTEPVATLERLALSDRQVSRLAAVVELAYKSRVALLDRMFGAVVAEIERHGLAAASAVVFTADHGETLYREDRRFRWTHGPDLVPEVIGVPLVVRAPGVAPRRIDAVSRSIDVFPTVAGLAGVAVPETAAVQGVDLSPALLGAAEMPRLVANSHGTLRQWSFFSPDLIDNIWATRKAGDLLYRWRRRDGSWGFEVFDLASSTALRDDLFDPGNPHHREVARDLWRYRSRLIERFRERNPVVPGSRAEELRSLTEAERKALESLGYIQP